MSAPTYRGRSRGFTLAPLLLVTLLGACAQTTARRATSVVNYLYPAGQPEAAQPSVPKLTLPLRVGIAFVPPAASEVTQAAYVGDRDAAAPETERVRLMETIAAHFRERPYVKSVEIIPTAYLTPGGGFANLDQIRNMFGVDEIVLIAFDQVQFKDQGMATLTYWTLVGAYVVQGEKHDTRTLMDAVVLDIPSRKLLFRAPGTSVVKGRSTPVNESEELRQDRQHGFKLATAELITALDAQLTAFQERLKAQPDEVKVVRTAEYEKRAAASGGGAVDAATLAILAALAGGALVGSLRRRRSGAR
ncbi:rhombotarget lipoprotein [Anaeromyxobacter sp. Red801]|uniref:rhombotarget lipoprotein n=1 Tax=Anaeromyxobacter sp. Red801 TaxID=3411632 RepID=UPI003BA1A464